jgi:hypothetical protein
MAIYEGFVWEMSRVASSELVVNGNFATDTRWTKPTGVTISGGTLNVSAATGKCYQSGGNGISLTSGKLYIVSFQVTAWTAGSFRSYIQSTPVYATYNSANGSVQAPGHYWFKVVCTSTSATSEFGMDFTGFTGTIDNFSIKEVDTTLITYKSNWASSANYDAAASSYLPMEFSYSDPGNNGKYTIIGGSDIACEVGASVLLHYLGFRFFGQTDNFVYRPASITTGLSRAKSERSMQWSSWGVNYGYGWGNPYLNDRYVLGEQYAHWTYLVGGGDNIPDPHGHRYEDVMNSNYAYFVANPTLLRQITGTVDPYANATLHFYETGTLTPANTYSDSGRTILNPNPITLTDTGTLPNAVYFAVGTTYKMVRKNYLGTEILVTDPVDELQLTWGTPSLPSRYKTLNLDGTYGTADWDKLVNLCAAFLYTSCVASQTFSTHFDSLDGSDFGTDLTVLFTNAVVAKIRSGADAIPGYYSARPPIPLARLGLLAYSDHAAPPTVPVHEGVYVQVATAFLNGLDYFEIFPPWSEACGGQISTYYYPNIITYTHNEPMYDGIMKTDGDKTAARVGYPSFNMEYGPSWVTTCVFAHWVNLQAIYPAATISYQDALDEIVELIFNNDAAVNELYQHWGKPQNYLNDYNLRESFDIVETMASSWYKTMFKRYLTFTARFRRAQKLAGTVDTATTQWPYVAEAVDLLYDCNAWNLASRMEGWTSNWAWAYYWGQWRVLNYPTIHFAEEADGALRDPLVGWYENPYYADDTDYTEEYEALQTITVRSADLADTELVVTTGLPFVASSAGAPYSTKNNQLLLGSTRILYVGPGTLTLTALTLFNDTTSTYYGPGIHEVITTGPITATIDGGILFVDGYPYPQRQFSGSVNYNPIGKSYIYVQPSAEGNVQIFSSLVQYIWDKNGRFDLFNDLETKPLPTHLGPGVIALDDVNSQRNLLLGNINPFISQDPDVMLMPKALFDAENPGRIRATRV